MSASFLSGIFSFGGALLLYFVSRHVDSRPIELLLYFLALGLVGWWVIWGHSLDGRVGESFEDLEKELLRLRAQIKQWETRPQGTSVPFDIDTVMRREQRIIEKMQFHPGRPSSRN